MNYPLASSDPRFLPLMTELTDLGLNAPDVASLAEGYYEKLVALGIPLDRASVHLTTLHSERIGTGRVWTRSDGIEETHYDYGTRNSSLFLDSPIRVVEETQKPLDIFPFKEGEQEFGISEDLRAEDIRHYALYPLFISDGKINTASFATKRPEGFDRRDQALIEDLLPLYTRVLEVKNLRRMIEEILMIYVGREPSNQILSGNIKRGQVSRLSAAMLLVDLRNSTSLSNRLPERKLVGILNKFFDCFVPPIIEQGGEVLKFIGDAVLAIFPQPDGMAPVSSPRERALRAVFIGRNNLAELNRQLGEDPAILEAGVALHLGRVAFGNVGSVERLDFTAIGPDVNLVARLASLCSRLDQPLLLSERFAAGMEQPVLDLGAHRLKGFAQRQKIFTLKDIKASQSEICSRKADAKPGETSGSEGD